MASRPDRLTPAASPLWRKAPLVLARFPWLLAALAVGALLLTVAAAAYPLFVSAATSQLLNEKIDTDPRITRYGAGIAYKNTGARLSGPGSRDHQGDLRYEEMKTEFANLAAESDLLGRPVASIRGPEVDVALADRPGRTVRGRLFSGTDAATHVTILAGHAGDGVLVPDYIANLLHVTPGDEISVRSRSGRTAVLEADAIYRALYTEPRTGYWQVWWEDIYGRACLDCLPPPFLIVGEHTLLELATELRSPDAGIAMQAPVRADSRLKLEDGHTLARLANHVRQEISDQETSLGRLFGCCHPLHFGNQGTFLLSSMDSVVQDVERRVGSIEGPGRVLQVAALAVSLLVLGAAGAFSQVARRAEARLLWARGMAPGEVGTKAFVESLLPATIGAGVGLALSFVLVRWFGPHGPIAPPASREALWGAGAALAFALVLITAVAAVSYARQGEHHEARLRILGRVPWELAFLGLAVFAGWRVVSEGALVGGRSLEEMHPSGWLLAFPVLALAGIAPLGARLFRLVSRALRSRSERFRPAPYLAVHRLAAGPWLAALLFVGASLCLGISIQALTIVGSISETVHAKAEVFVGSDVQGSINLNTPLPSHGAVPFPFTEVTRRLDAGAFDDSTRRFDLLAVDPSTLSSAAFWNGSFADHSLEEIADRLAGAQAGALPVVLAGADLPEPSTLQIDLQRVPVEVVDTAFAFPGMSSERPLVVVDREAVENAAEWVGDPLTLPGASTELWVRGDPDLILPALSATRYAPLAFVTAREVEDIPSIAAVVATFIALGILGLATAALVVAGLLMYLQARQRSQLVSHGLSLRMGMRDASHRRALVLELAAMLGSSYALGAAIAVGAAFVLVPRLDPLGAIPPAPFFVIPVREILLAIAALFGVCWVGAWAMSMRARSRALGEVLRVAD